MELTLEQELAKNKIVEWYNDKNTKQQVFFLSGFAGTGKTYLISYILQHALNINENDYAFCAPTGKAATVLINKNNNACTIHKLIYKPIERKSKIIDPETGIMKVKRTVEFLKRDKIDKKLIIVDEFSMVDYSMYNDLCSYGIKILAVGDIGQLPPIRYSNNEEVAGSLNRLLANPHAQLTTILRQHEDNYILRIAEMARYGQPIPYGAYGDDVYVYDMNSLTEEQLLNLYLNADQILAGTNNTVNAINKQVRAAKGFTDELPEPGDKLICLLNNYDIPIDDRFTLTNGMIGSCDEFTSFKTKSGALLSMVTFAPDLSDEIVEGIVCDPYEFMTEVSPYYSYQLIYQMPNGKYEPKMEIKKSDKQKYGVSASVAMKLRRNAVDTIKLNRFAFGYCITCHKSQGSEWDTVVIIDESKSFHVQRNKWLYTAITRAKKKCIILRP